MVKRFDQPDLSRLGDDKALAIAAFGQSVTAYRYIVLAEKSADPRLTSLFEDLVIQENARRGRIQQLMQQLFPSTCFFLDMADKSMVCVGPRLLDARDDDRFDEAMKLLIASEKRSSSFYARYAAQTLQPQVKRLFADFAQDGLQRVNRLRRMFEQAGRPINELCPLRFMPQPSGRK